MSSENARFPEILKHYNNTDVVQCAVLCEDLDDCTSVNHNTVTGVCELTTFVPGVVTPSTDTEDNWKVYHDDRIIRAVDEWQQSTFVHYNNPLIASYATDGNRDNNDQGVEIFCASSASTYSYWGMEFDRFAEVSHVIVFFRNLASINNRNTNLRLLISATRRDADNNIGTDCANYAGPPATPSLPVKILCAEGVTGKFLKIIHNIDQLLCLCEVEVYSV